MTAHPEIPSHVHHEAIDAARVAALAYEPRLKFEPWMAFKTPKDPGGRATLPPLDHRERQKWLAMSTARWTYQRTIREWRKTQPDPA